MPFNQYLFFLLLFFSFASTTHAFTDTLPDGYEFANFQEEEINVKDDKNHNCIKALLKKDVPDSNHAMETLEAGPSAVVAGCVNAITGDYFESNISLVVPGTLPLLVQCSYCSSEKEWNFLHMPSLNVGRSDGGNHLYARYSDDNGSGLTFRAYFDKNSIKDNNLTIPSALFEKGLTNCGSGMISGKTNWRNSYISMIRRHDKKSYLFTHGSGINRIFFDDNQKNGEKKDLVEKFKGAPLGQFHLESENHLNGNRLLYRYTDGELTRIKAVNQTNQELSRASLERNRSKIVHWISDSGVVTFNFEDSMKKRVNLISPSHAVSLSYKYNKYNLLEKKIFPEGRFLGIKYFTSGESKGRVSSLVTPRGLAYTFQYFLESCETNVYDAEQNLTTYCYDKKTKRLQSIKRYNQAKKIIRQENFYWSKDGNLDAKTFMGGGKNYFSRTLGYDTFGNVTQDSLFGNLTGNSLQPLELNGASPTTFCEEYLKTYHYSQDGQNLLLVENDSKKLICFDYYPNQLLKSRLTKNIEGKIIKREFFDYDANGVLIKEIWDDGQDIQPDHLTYVNERHLKIITPRTVHPIGLPQIVEEYYLDMRSDQYHLVKKTVNHHSMQGKIFQEDHYGSDGNYAYSLKWDHDNLGNVKKKIDALGQTTTYDYDGNSNKIREDGPLPGWHKEFQYDLCNNLIQEIEYWPDGTIFTIGHDYNSLNQRIATRDIHGQLSGFEYNTLGHLVKTQSPNMFNSPLGVITPMEETEYDAMGNAIVKKDANGQITKTSYTIRGQPYRIEYPDGSVEQKEYSLEGLLIKEISKNGLITTYTYDPFDRIIATHVTDPQGTIQKTKTASYSTFHLWAETDEEGMVTNYEYDWAGRCTAVRKGDHLTKYEYDTLGRIVKTLDTIDDANIHITCKVYDLLDRVIEERIEDQHGEIFKQEQYSYDTNGNKNSTTLFTQAGVAKTETEYHPNGKPSCITDALGNKTRYFYDHAFSYKGQTVLFIKKVDPLGNQEVMFYDTHGNVCYQAQIDSFGSFIQRELSYYDPLGHKTLSEITVFQGYKEKNIIETRWEYDAMGNMTRCIEAVGTPEQKIVKHDFNRYGQKEVTYMPNGISILNEYDSFGRLSTYRSTDNTIHYQYTYDVKDRLTLVKDLVHNTETRRAYDEHGRLISETLDNGLALCYTYDQLDRPTSLTLPDKSAIHYHYNATHLTSLERIKNDEVAYTHHYNYYDLAGNVTEETLLGQAGKIHYRYDLLERPISVHTPHWQLTIPQGGFDAVGNLLERKVTDKQGPLTYTYAYDSLYQLISENGHVSHNYQNDSVYNRTTKNNQTHTVNGLNQLLSQTNCSYRYDNNGNLIEKTADNHQIRYIYDALDRLIEVHNGSDITKYTYDSFHRRLSKIKNGLTTHYLYQNQNEIGAFEQGKMSQLRILGISFGAEIGGAVALELNGKTYAPIHDPQGNIVALLDSSGNLVEGYRYTAFGETEIFTEKAVDNPWRYSSKRFDAETGFLYFGRRYYDPEIGRWTTSDPAGYADGPNLYTYVHNQPLAYIDPDGRFSLPTFICSHEPEQVKANATAFFSNSYIQGTMQAVGGLTEACIGSGIFVGTGGLGCVPGALITAHGLDNYIAGMNTLMTGKHTDTATSLLLQMTGMSSQSASVIDGSMSMVGSIGGVAAIRASQAAVSNFQIPKFEAINALKDELDALSIARQSYSQKQLLNTHLYQLEEYGSHGFRQLQNNRIRYYDRINSSRNPGEMIGRRKVREWDPNTGLKRTWHETLDGNNNVRIVRPQRQDGIKIHYEFDHNGNFTGTW